jgi:hypothetical protein
MAEDERSMEARVEEALASFDFDLVSRVMEWLGWTWANLGRVPTRGELAVEARRLFKDLGEAPGVLGSGGLRASIKEDGVLSLKFILCESWSDQGDGAA